MSKYPLIEAIGLEICKVRVDLEIDMYFVYADQLEQALQAAPEVLGSETTGWHNEDGKVGSHWARVVCIQPIKKKTRAERIADLVEGWSRSGDIINYKYLKEAIDKILEMPE